MEIAINQALQKLSNTFLDYFNLFVTQFGDELFFIVLAVIFYWCVDKKFGYKLINIYLWGVAIADGIKNLVQRPRPYTQEGVASIGKETPGYSFPSGHSHTISNLMTQVNRRYDFNLKLFIPSVILILLVMLSRLYLGQHYLTDVLTGCALGVFFAIVFSSLFELLGDKEENIAFVVVPLCIIVSVCCIFIKNTELASNILKVTGGYSAVTIGYYLEKHFVKAQVKASAWQNAIKILLGLVIVFACQQGLKYVFPKNILFLYSFLRYFIVGISASLLSLWLFKVLKLSKSLDKKE